MYGPDDATVPQGWVHNMEHGGLVLLYKCPGPGCTDEGQAALKAFYAAFPNSPQCNLAPGIVGPVFARFDGMDSPYMALVWDMTLPLDTLDTDQIRQFFARNGEQFNGGEAVRRADADGRAHADRRPDVDRRAGQHGPDDRSHGRAGQRLGLAELTGHERLMLALVKAEAGPGLRLQDVPKPEIGINDVLIRVHKTGICGTDLHIESWDPWAAKTIKPPLVVGHEFVGEVVEVGSNVTDFHPGELVSGEGHVTCGLCRHCLAGQRHLCVDTVGLGVGRDGAFAEFVALPMTNVWHQSPASTRRSPRSSTPSGTRSTRRWPSRSWARTSS